MKSLSKFLVFVLLLWGANKAVAQGSLKDDEARKSAQVKTIVNGGRYTFEAEKEATGKHAGMRLRVGDLDISKDTLIAYLPNAGKTPGSPEMARAAGITCINFDYNVTQGNHNNWMVTIVPKEKRSGGIEKVNMDINKEGYATVTVKRANEKPMKFYGYIMQHEAVFPNNPVAVR
jgi:hypothetical protein